MNELKPLAEESETERERERRPSLYLPTSGGQACPCAPVAEKLRGKEGERVKEGSNSHLEY
jgi:hypothetical protein